MVNKNHFVIPRYFTVAILGTYEDCVGTNLFFEENEQPTEAEDQLKPTPIKLNYVTKQFKIVDMQWAKLAEDPIEETTDDYDIKFKEDYDSILKKMEKGALKIEDLEIRKNDESVSDKNKEPAKVQQTETVFTKPAQPSVANKMAKKSDKQKKKAKQQNVDVNIEKYTKLECLMQLAREPLKLLPQEESCEIPNNLKVSYVYNSFKSKLLRENSHFDPFIVNYNSHTLEGAVDINRCIRQGLIKPSGNNVTIDRDTKNALLTLQNFENLSLPMRYCVLRSHMKKQKRYIHSATEKELQQVTELGVNVRDSYKIIKMLAADVKERILLKQTIVKEMKKNNEDESGTKEDNETGNVESDKDEDKSVESVISQ